ncbi:MAG: glycosyltransferase [Lentisphaerae bacterium]|nr:glycosyltransferase [Lentisphaerota bacterium]
MNLPPSIKSGWPWGAPAPVASDPGPWPRISIVTPSYQQVAYLEATIRSVLLQGYPNLEYVIIDNASTDGSVDVIRTYAAHLAGWVSEPDRGQSHAINKGFARCGGDIMAWLNADDLLLPGALLAVGRAWRRRPFDVLSGHARFIAADGRPEGLFGATTATAVDHLRLRTPGVPQQATFWSAASWQRHGPLDESLHLVMDLDYWLKLLIAGVSWDMLDQELACFRHHAAQKTHDLSNNLALLAEKQRVFERYATDPRMPADVRNAAVRGLDELWVKAWTRRYRQDGRPAPFPLYWLAAPLSNWRCLRVRAFYGALYRHLVGA